MIFYPILLSWPLVILGEELQKGYGMGKMVQGDVNTPPKVFQKYAISTDSPVCSDIGAKTMSNGGNAIDAAVVALICLSIVHPHSSGIGGGGLMMVHHAESNKNVFIDFRETAPMCSSPDMAEDNHTLIIRGGLAVAVPGELRGYYRAWKLFSKLPWSSLFEPSIKLAREGVRIDASLGIALERWSDVIKSDPLLSEVFTKDGNVLKNGGNYSNPTLANTLEAIADSGGANIFYQNFSKRIAKEIREVGGCVKEQDIHSYAELVKDPVVMKLGSVKMLLSPFPTSGPLLGLILKVFEGFHFGPRDLQERPVTVYHALIETLKFAYSKRTDITDPNFDNEAGNLTETLISSSFADRIRKKIILDKTFPPDYYGTTCGEIKTGTTHVSVVDKHNNMVSVTSTINGYFGAKFGSQDFGFVYNNEMDDFCYPGFSNDYMLPPSSKNYPSGGRRPVSSGVPTIILDSNGEPLLAIGGSGGSIITSSVAEVLIFHIIFEMSLSQAIKQPRLHTQLTPDVVYFESRFNTTVIEKLKEMGHKVEVSDVYHGVVQALEKTFPSHEWLHHTYRKKLHNSQHTIFAESDFRKGGSPAGG